MPIHYFIRPRKDEETSTIWFRFNEGQSIDIKRATMWTIPTRYWDSKKKCIKVKSRGSRHFITPEEEEIFSIQDHLDGLGEFLENRIKENPRLVSSDWVQEQMNTYYSIYVLNGSEETTEDGIPVGMLEYLDWRIAGMKRALSGENGAQIMTDNDEPFSQNTVKQWSNFHGVLSGFMEYWKDETKANLTWETINPKVTDAFRKYLEKDYMRSSINKYIASFRALVHYGFKDGIHNNYRAVELFRMKKEKDGDSSAKVYLTERELEQLYHMELTGLKKEVRDLFLIGTWLGQRISDYSSLTRENFIINEAGEITFHRKQQKTGKEVDFPVLNRELIDLLEEYNYKVPNICGQLVNRYIKQICKELSKTVPSLGVLVPTYLTQKERLAEEQKKAEYKRVNGVVMKHKYDCICSHTARRSCITNYFLAGVSNETICKVSGHSTVEMMLRYVQASGAELARMIAPELKKYEEMRRMKLDGLR